MRSLAADRARSPTWWPLLPLAAWLGNALCAFAERSGWLDLFSSVPDIPPQRHRYHRLARRLTMRSPISLHLLLISLGVRAHIRHDLGIAIERAIHHRPQRLDRPSQLRRQLVGTLSAGTFPRAALDFVGWFVGWHRQRRPGWRRMVLGVHSVGLRILKPVWIGVVEVWRAAAIGEGLRSSAPCAAPPARRASAADRSDRGAARPIDNLFERSL